MSDTPIGTIVAYAGPVTAEWEVEKGWMVCNGRSVDRTQEVYRVLFDAIGSSWGGDGANKFNIPDLRGYFLRGVDEQSGRDPDAASRTAISPGGHAGPNVGSIQGDELGTHSHTIESKHLEAQAGGGFDGAGFDSNSGGGGPYQHPYSSNQAGANETRPKNAAVYWIIRYR